MNSLLALIFFQKTNLPMENIQQDILTTTLELFNDKGLDFTMDDIAQSMHIAKKTIYRFFSSKEDLLKAVEAGGNIIQEIR